MIKNENEEERCEINQRICSNPIRRVEIRCEIRCIFTEDVKARPFIVNFNNFRDITRNWVNIQRLEGPSRIRTSNL